MKQIRYTGYLIIGSAQSINVLLKEKGAAFLADLGFPDGSGYVLANVSIVVLAFGVKWLYDKLLWRMIFPGKDLNGKWSYSNVYTQAYTNAAQEAPTSGEVTVTQTPDKIMFVFGKRKSGGADWSSLSMDMDDDGRHIHLTYKVTRTLNGHHRSITSYEFIEIAELRPVGLLRLQRPVRLSGSFNNLMMTTAALTDVRTAFGQNWEPQVGSGTYVRQP